MTSNRLHGLIKDIFPFPLLPLFLLVGIFYVTFVCRVAIAPLLPAMKVDLGLGLAGAGSLFFWMASGYCAGLLMSGFVTARLSHRKTILLSVVGMGAGMLVLSQASSTVVLYVSLIFSGLSAGLYLPSGIALLSGLVSPEHLGKAVSIHELAPNLGFVTAPLITEALFKIFSWRGILVTLGIWSILMGLIFMFLGKGGDEKGEAPRLRVTRSILVLPSFWVMAAFFIAAIGSSIGVYSMMPLFLMSERGMSRESANMLTSFSRMAGFITLFFSGWMMDRAGHKQAAVIFVGMTGGLILLIGLISYPPLTPLLFVLQTSASVCIFPVGFVMLAVMFDPSRRNLAMSLVVTIGYLLGGGVIPAGIGYVAEKLSFSWSFSILGLLVLSVIPLLFLIRPEDRAGS